MKSQSPTQQIAERIAEAAPGLVAAAHLTALDDGRREARALRQRVADAHRWQAEALGTTALHQPEEEPMGNLVVTGDVYGSDAAEIIRALQVGRESATPPVPAAQVAAEPAPPTPIVSAAAPPIAWRKALATSALLAAGLLGAGGAGAGVPWLLGAYDKPAAVSAAPAVAPAAQRLDIDVIKGGAF